MASRKTALIRGVVLLAVIAVSFWTGFLLYPVLGPRFASTQRPASIQTTLSRDEYLKLSGEIYDTLSLQYYQQVDATKLLKGQVAGLGDPYTVLLTPAEAADFREELAGEYVGIGVVISENAGADAVEIVRVFRGTPAEEAGLEAGDIILAIDGADARGLGLDVVSARVKGKAGTSVHLKVGRGDASLEYTIVRRQVELPVVESKIIANDVGYVSVSSFSSGVATKFSAALKALESKKITGLVIDIRDNGGGYLNECLDMLAQFIPDGTALWTKAAGGEMSPVTVHGRSVSYPVVVLVNQDSASASEIFAAALKENKAATIVGTTTYGKGLIQRSWDLSDGFELKVTVEEYFTPDKNAIQKKGLTPDVEVTNPSAADVGTLPGDGQLARAVELLRQGGRP
jgi:carboxyl-terminal processing protease